MNQVRYQFMKHHFHFANMFLDVIRDDLDVLFVTDGQLQIGGSFFVAIDRAAALRDFSRQFQRRERDLQRLFTFFTASLLAGQFLLDFVAGPAVIATKLDFHIRWFR